MKTHVLIGSVESIEYIRKSAKKDQQIIWIAPKTAKPLDRILIYVHGKGIIASGEIQSKPRPSESWGDGWYEADIEKLRLIPAISLEELQARLPKWKWTTYPRGYTTPRQEIETELLEFIESRK